MRALFYGQFFTIILLCATLNACMVGPDFVSPRPPQVSSYTKPPLPKKTVRIPKAGAAGKAQTFIYPKRRCLQPLAPSSCSCLKSTLEFCDDAKNLTLIIIPEDWWYLFHSAALNNLIQFGLTNSPTMAAAQAALRVSEETLNAQIGADLYPQVTGQLAASRQRFTNQTFGVNSNASIFNLFNAQFNVSYTLDVFGGLRRGLEALSAQVDHAQFELRATYLTLTSNIVTTAITDASLRAQIQVNLELIKLEQDQLNIVKKRFNLGAASNADIFALESQLAQTRALLPPLQQSLAQTDHALAILVGVFPNSKMPQFYLNQLTLPTQLPISLPSELVRQRPDIQAAEALLHAASAQIGVATANLLPNITLNAYYGATANHLSDLFSSSSNIWFIGSTLLQPIFNGGSLHAKRRAAIAAYHQAFANYREVVLKAFQNVADSLRALQHDAQTLLAQKQAEIAAKNSLVLVQKQFKLGATSYLALLIAQQQYQQARIGSIRAAASRYIDTAALFQALGGSWWSQEK